VSPEIVTIIAPAVVFAVATVLLTYLIIALSVASTIVDVSPFATNGALVLADTQDVDRDPFYEQILGHATIVVAVGPLLAWLVFVVVPSLL
jgi:hypothetical protein